MCEESNLNLVLPPLFFLFPRQPPSPCLSELSVREDQQGLSETVRSEGFTLGLSDLNAPDITHDIITSKTELYAPPDDTATTFTIASQDKDTIIGTQIQREMGGMKDEEEKDMEVVGEQKEYKMEIDNKDGEDLAVDAGQREALVRQEESKSQTEEVADSRTGEDEELAKSQTEGEVAESPTEGEEEEMTESQTEDVADEGRQVVEKGLTSQSLVHNAMRISRRAYCSEGGVKVAGVMEGGRGYKSMGAELHPTETVESGW